MNLYRLCILVTLLFSATANAAPAPWGERDYFRVTKLQSTPADGSDASPNLYRNDPTAACMQWSGFSPSTFTTLSANTSSPSSTRCWYTHMTNGNYYAYGSLKLTKYTCPVGKLFDETSQTCKDPSICEAPLVNVTYPPGGCNCPIEGDVVLPSGECGPPVTECEMPNVYVPELGQCAHPDCPVGQTMQEVVVVEGQPPVDLCADPMEPLPEDQGCNILDPAVEYAENVPICASEKSGCDAAGGVIIVLPNGTKRCYPLLPEEEPENPEDPPPPREPKCPSSDFVAWDLDVGDYVCRPKSPDPKDIPDSEKPPKKDTDDDGTPDSDDGDMDGDGTGNSTDSDIDGDGIANGDDPQPWGGSGPGEGEGEGESESVTGGGNCIDRPQCTGSPVECAIVYQAWKTRCEVEKLNAPGDLESLDREESDLFGLADLNTEIDDAKTEFTDLVDEFRGLVSGDVAIGGAGSLPCLGTFSYSGETTEWCLDEYSAQLSNIGPAILFISYFIAAIIVLRR